jgi:hypothetical protein
MEGQKPVRSVNMSKVVSQIAEAADVVINAIKDGVDKDKAVRKYIDTVEPTRVLEVMMFITSIMEEYINLLSECDHCSQKASKVGSEIVYHPAEPNESSN